MKRLYILPICLLTFITSKAQITQFKSNNVGIGVATDNGHKLEVLRNATGQTTSSRVSSFHNSGSTFNTASGPLTSYAGHFLSTSTKVSGTNSLTNVGLYAAASGSTYNYAAVFPTGQVVIGTETPYFEGGNLVVNGVTSPIVPVMTINTPAVGGEALHIRYGATQGYPGTLAARITTGGAALFNGLAVGTTVFSRVSRSLFSSEQPGYIAQMIEGAQGQTANIFQIINNPIEEVRILSVTKDGFVGVGTSGPTKKFQVNGTVRVECSYEAGSGLLITKENFVNGSVIPNTNGGIDIASANSSLSFTASGIRAIGNITAANKVMIGSVDPALTGTHSLAVNGSAIFNKVVVRTYPNWPDYVFSPAYKLRSLQSLEKFIHQHSHLPDVPSAQDIEKKGVDIAEVQAALLKKIEELTLYVIGQDKKLTIQGEEIKKLKDSYRKK